MIAAIRAQVEKEKAEKEAKLKQGQANAGGSTQTSGGGKPQFKTLSAEDLQRLEEKKRRKQAGEPVDDAPFEPSAPVKEEVKKEPVSSAGLDTGLGGVGVQTETGLGESPAGDSLVGAPAGDSLQGGLGGGLGSGLGGDNSGGGLNISGLDSSVTSIQESSFSANVMNEQDGGWVAASAGSDIPTIETPAPKKNLDDDGNLISVVPIKQDASAQDVKSMYNIDFDDEDASSGDGAAEAEAARKAAEAEAAEEARRKEEAEAAKKAAQAEAAKKKAAEDAAKKAAEDDAARQAAINATKKADEDARRAAERAAKKAAEDETIKKAKEEAAKRKAAEDARKKAAEESARAAYANEIQSKATTANRRLDTAAQRVIEANNKVASLDDQEKNHTKYVDEALAKIDAETEDKVSQVKNAEDGRVKAVADSFVAKREALDADFAAKEEEAKKQLEDEKAAKTAQLGQIEQDQKDKKLALEKENENKKEALKQEETDKKAGLNEDEEKAKADVNQALADEREKLEEALKQDARAAEDALNEVKENVANADNLIQAAIDHVAEVERQLEEARQAVEKEKQNKLEAESRIAAKEEDVAAQKAQAESKRSELENSFKDKLQQVTVDYDGKRDSLVSEYVDKQNRLVEDYNSQCAALDNETEKLLEQTRKELEGLDAREDANKLNRQAGLEEKKQALAAEESAEIAKAKEQTQSEIDACRQQGEQEKTAYVAKANDEVEGVRIQLKEAKDEAASLMQVYEITKRSAIEAMESAKRVGIEISMPALDIEIPAGAVKAAAPKSKAAASAPKSDAPASDVSIPVSVMEFMGKYLDATTIAASVRKSLTDIVANPTGNKNILVLGKHGFGSTVVGNDFARAFYAAGICSSKTIANIKSAALNKRPLESVKDKLKGGCLVVENAGTLTVDRLQEIAKVGKDPANDITIIFTGEKDRVNYVIKDAGISDLFAHTVLMTDVDDTGMFAIAKAYAKQLGYTLESAAESTLKNKLKEIEDGNLDRYLKMVDDAIAKAKTQGETSSLASVDFS